MAFFDWWASLSPGVRIPIAMLLILGSAFGLVTIRIGYGLVWGTGLALGVVLLFHGPSKANRSGYHF